MNATSTSTPRGIWACFRSRVAEPVRAGFWLRRLRTSARPVKPLDSSPLLVVAPHQDDETLGCGGLIALKRRLGAPVTVIFVTDGASSPSRGNTPVKEWTARRRQEALEALAVLGVPPAHCHFLDGPDGGLNDLSAARTAALTGELAGLISATSPTQVAVTFRKDGHPDHEASFLLVARAIRQLGHEIELWEYPVWSLWRKPADSSVWLADFALRKLDIRQVVEIKKQAAACFVSQISPGFFHRSGHVPAPLVRRLTGPEEIFFVTRFRPDAVPDNETTAPFI
jgi:N-acetylglucosamine malate deacetylase 1